MGERPEPTRSSARAATPPPNQKPLDTERIEIVVLAISILFLVSQLVLIIWLFAPRAFARRPREQVTFGWMPEYPKSVPQEAIFSDEDDGRPARRRNYRRSSTWNGRSAATSQDGHPVRRRKSSGLKPADSSTFPIPDLESDSSDRDSSMREGLRDVDLAISVVPLSSRRLRSPLSSPGPEPESDSSNGSVREIGLFPATFSPRSPRVGPINMAAVSAIVKANERKPSQTVVSPLVMDATELTSSFDDPMGVPQRKVSSGSGNSVSMNECFSDKEYP